MSDFATNLVNKIGVAEVVGQFEVTVKLIARETGQNQAEAKKDLAARMAEYLRANPRPLSAYERILDDVANGRPRPRNFDASGP